MKINIGNTNTDCFKYIQNNIYLKREDYNPTRSIKDRSVWYMIKQFINNPKSHFIMASSGNAGVSLAYFCKLYNCKSTIFCPPDAEISKIEKIEKLGSELVICKDSESNEEGGWIFESRKFYNENKKQGKNVHYIDQFSNSQNILAHKEGTAKEIFDFFEQNNKKLDYIFIGIGSAGTSEGIRQYISETNQSTKVIVCDPIGGIFYDTFKGNEVVYVDHKIASISDSFIPKNISTMQNYHDVVQCSDEKVSIGRELLFKNSGIYAGDVTSFVFNCLSEYIEKYDLQDCNFLLINTEEGLR